MLDKKYMLRAIELAKKGAGFVNPNPMVGAVIVKDDKIIGEGWHREYGSLHAERNAFASLSESAEGATLYVTLEPCCHQGKTPPCTDAIIENKISRVVIGSADPNPLVSGKGVRILRDAGIEVIQDFLKAECDGINPIFFHYITTHTPYVVMKYAMSLDGKIATASGESKWITGESARQHVHSLRGMCSSILAGIGTVLADDPMLNCRIEGLHQPLRVIADSRLRIPLDSRLVKSASEYRTVVATGEIFDKEKLSALEKAGVEVISLPGSDSRVDIAALMQWLSDNNIDSVLSEGGGSLADSLLRGGFVNKVMAYIAPKLIGGKEAKTPIGGCGIASLKEAPLFKLDEITVLDEDVLLEYSKV